MYNVWRLFGVVRDGFGDMLPALRAAFNDDPIDDRMAEVYGSRPRIAVFGLTVAGAGLGLGIQRVQPDLPYIEYINWPAAAAALVFAWLLRRYLFKHKKARCDDFPWLAASVAPAIGLLVLIDLILNLSTAFVSGAADQQRFGSVLVAVTQALGIAAAMTITMATLCFSRDWPKALLDLAIRLIVFRILIWVTTLVTIEIGIVGQVLGGLLEGLTGWAVPQWLKDLSDQVSYAILLGTAYLAIIGATWTVCRRSFGELIETGQVDILKAIEQMAGKPKQAERPGKDPTPSP